MKNSCKKPARFNVILAFCLIGIGLFVNPWLLGYLVRPTSVPFEALVFIGAFEIFLIISGLLVYFKGNTAKERKQLAFGYVAFALVIILVECGLHVTNFAVHRGDQEQGLVGWRCSLSPYEGKEWAETYWKESREFWTANKDYEPFLVWDTAEYHGEYINVNSEGVRKTWNPGFPDGDVPNTIYVFGGSTAWGAGARDDYTIPSCLSKLLNDNGYDFAVYNYGESAYVSTQEVIQLILLLKEGHRPDYVIFYDGANDVYVAYQSGIIGAHHNLSIIREKLSVVWSTERRIQDIQRLVLGKLYWILAEDCMIYRAVGNISALTSHEQQFQEVASNYNDKELQLLATGIAEDYLKVMNLLDHLAQAYGFEYICFWQPVICTENKLTDEEAEYTRVKDTALASLYRMTTDSLVAKSPPYFFNITDALSDRLTTYYIDWAHVSEEGNRVVAAKIFQIFEGEFLSSE